MRAPCSVLLIAFLVPSALASSASTQQSGQTPPLAALPPAPSPWNLTAEPATLRAGQQYILTVRVPDADCPKDKNFFTDLDSVVAATPADLTVGKPSFTTVLANNCLITVPVTVKEDAPSGKEYLLFEPKPAVAGTAHNVLGLLPVTIQNLNPPPANAVPTPSPKTDIMWKVLPRQAVADSYGDRVANGFFAVEVTLGNNSGYDLQLAALGFALPNGSKKPDGDPKLATTQDQSKPPIPVDDYPVVRGTVEREQSVGTRAIIVNLVKGSGSVLVGVGSAYFNGTGGLFNPAVAIFSSTFEKGLELVYPDLTTNHLIALDNRTLHDGVTIHNNTSVRINAFISRELIQCGPARHWYTFSTRASRFNYSCKANDSRLPYSLDFSPAEIMEHLGEMVLVGRSIQYLDRVQIVADKGGKQVLLGPIVTGTLAPLKQPLGWSPTPITITGKNLQNAQIYEDGTSPDLTVAVVSVAQDGTSATFIVDTSKLSDADKAQNSPHRLIVKTPIDLTSMSLEVDPPK